MKNKRFLQILGLTLVLALTMFCVPVYASGEVYQNCYSPADAIAYGEKYGESVNPKYGFLYVENENGIAVQEDCTYFISQCLVAGGLPETDQWSSKDDYLWLKIGTTYDGQKVPIRKWHFNEGFETFVNADKLNHYLESLGYRVEKNVHLSGDTLSVSSLSPAPGDILQYDWDGDGTIDHSVLYCGIVDGVPRYSAHSASASMQPLSKLDRDIRPPVALDGRIYGTVTYLIHMTEPASVTSPPVAASTTTSSTPPNGEAPSASPSNTNRVNQLYCGSGYSEGIYTGEYSGGKPNGYGKLEYTDRNGDGLFYTLTFGTQCYRATSYEGYFKDGFRFGEGTVEYEGGYRATGSYYGAWQAEKTVFEGTLYYPDGTARACRMVCDSNLTANWYSR